MNRKADWLTWIMHAALGVIAGGLLGLFLVMRLRRGFLFEDISFLPYVIGTALIGAGLGSRYGDRLWFADDYRLIPIEEPEQSTFSDWLSWFLVAGGVATGGVAILKDFQFI